MRNDGWMGLQQRPVRPSRWCRRSVSISSTSCSCIHSVPGRRRWSRNGGALHKNRCTPCPRRESRICQPGDWLNAPWPEIRALPIRARGTLNILKFLFARNFGRLRFILKIRLCEENVPTTLIKAFGNCSAVAFCADWTTRQRIRHRLRYRCGTLTTRTSRTKRAASLKNPQFRDCPATIYY